MYMYSNMDKYVSVKIAHQETICIWIYCEQKDIHLQILTVNNKYI